MSLAHRIIPTILSRGRQAVKGVAFDSWRSIGTVAEKVRVHALRGVDELVILDITATNEGRGPYLSLIEYLSENLFAPLTVGGGVRSVEHVKQLLRAGADKVAICSEANMAFIGECAKVVGSQAIVVSLDVKHGVCWTHSGTRNCVTDPVYAAKCFATAGAGEILLQSIERDGVMEGYDLDLIRRVSEAVDIPVIASGGCGTYEHMREALDAGASAVAAGAMFQFTDNTPKGAAEYLAKQGVEVRL